LRAICTGDLHIRNDNLNNIHINSILGFLDHITDYYFKNEIDYLFVIGDVFHKSSNIKNEAFIPIFMKFFAMKEKGIKMIFIPGNHDIMNVNNDTIIETFAAFGDVYKTKTSLTIDNEEFIFLPYTKKESEIPKGNGEYLITHLSIADFNFNNYAIADEKLAFKRELFEDFKMVITGHFHKYQNKGNIYYIGSPVQVDRGEMGQTKGFGVLDTGTESIEFVEYDLAPKFVEVTEKEIEQIDKMDFSNCHVVVRINSKIKDFAKLRYILYEKGAINIIPIFETVTESSEPSIQIEEISNIGDIIEDIIKDENVKPENLNTEELTKTFEKIRINTK
jgi:DNA repair exonuclease SbcCD nuclease subunit